MDSRPSTMLRTCFRGNDKGEHGNDRGEHENDSGIKDMKMKTDIKNLTMQELESAITSGGWPRYRVGQIASWVYQKGCAKLKEMNNIPKELIESLEKEYYIGHIELSKRLKSYDKTEKFVFRLHDGEFIESVLIRSKKRKTICISTQVGCKFACSFCASGLKGFIRNLTTSEILSQILYLRNNLKHEITNYVFMGMGEPLDNYDNLIKAILIMNEPKMLKIGARRITISTSGIAPAIKKLKTLNLQINLSISLHAGNDSLRNKLMPINKKYPLKELISVCKGFLETGGRKITLEYTLLKGINDTDNDVDELSIIANKLNAKVNLVPFSVSPGLKFSPTLMKRISTFNKRLFRNKVDATIRDSKGADIKAACGQLAGNS